VAVIVYDLFDLFRLDAVVCNVLDVVVFLLRFQHHQEPHAERTSRTQTLG
jgi:hypothetical protein